jgi:hypothetical protein
LVVVFVLIANGLGRALRAEFHSKGSVSALKLCATGITLLVFASFFLSIVIKPNHSLFLIQQRRGQAAIAIVICSVIYGFFLAKRNTEISEKPI